MNYLNEFGHVWPTYPEHVKPTGIEIDRIASGAEHRPLILIEDEGLLERECLGRALQAFSPEFRVVTRPTRAEAPEDIRPDAVVVGVDSDGGDCEAAAELLRSLQNGLPNVPIVVLAEDAEAMTATAGLCDIGISGCLSHSVGIEGLTKVLWLVLHGGACFPRRSICQRRAATVQEGQPAPENQRADAEVSAAPMAGLGLTERERDVVGKLRMGKPNKIIAYELGISISTVKVHVRNIMRKTGATNRVEAALLPGKPAFGPAMAHTGS
ncbi:MAG: response regulator transcription factor [Paracoccaceae bacterium]|nr:response regulator transcription factor [Paracoccaceae bacterium]